MPIDALWADSSSLRERLEALAGALGGRIVPSPAFVGGGSAPDAEIPGEALCLQGEDSLHPYLRRGLPWAGAEHGLPGRALLPVVGFCRDGHLILDLRTVAPSDDPLLTAAVRRAREEEASDPRRGPR